MTSEVAVDLLWEILSVLPRDGGNYRWLIVEECGRCKHNNLPDQIVSLKDWYTQRNVCI